MLRGKCQTAGAGAGRGGGDTAPSAGSCSPSSPPPTPELSTAEGVMQKQSLKAAFPTNDKKKPKQNPEDNRSNLSDVV